jgi:ATP-binding cassette, subfamily B, multidrug efflux pump
MMHNLMQRAADEDDLKKPKFKDSYLFSMLWRFLRPYRWQLLCVIGLLLAVSGLTILLPYLIQQTVDGPIAEGDLSALVPFGIGYLLTIVAIFGLRFAYTYWLQTIGQNALMHLRQTLYEHIMRQDLQYFHKTPVGKIVARMSNDIEALTELLSTSIVMVASNMLTLAGIIVVMFVLNWRLALLSLAVLPLMIYLSTYFRRILRRVSGRYHKIMGEYLAFLNEQFNGMTVVQLFGRQQNSRADFAQINQDYFDAHNDIRDTYTIYASFLQILTAVGMGLLLYGGGSGVLAGWASIGMLIAFIEYTLRAFEPIMGLSEQYAQIQTGLSAGERIAQMLQSEPTIKQPSSAQPVQNFEQRIDFEQVRFWYEADHPVLKGIDLHIAPGQRVAIVGATGAGKTTLVKLLARYYDVQAGSVKLSGVDVRDLSTRDLRRFVTVVPQNPYCFNGTIADNLRLFDHSVTLQQMQAAARVARAETFIEALPAGYEFELLPAGANLSQGQRQLLALARALIHSPESILVLDEATSSIDTETEELIQAGLEQVLAGRTSLIIAHRLSTVRNADRILVMQQGEIVEDGTHDDLLAQDGVYARLYQRQFADERASAGEAAD